MTGWQTLFYKEVLRFWKVSFQTIAAPILTALLYLLIFSHVLEGRVDLARADTHACDIQRGIRSPGDDAATAFGEGDPVAVTPHTRGPVEVGAAVAQAVVVAEETERHRGHGCGDHEFALHTSGAPVAAFVERGIRLPYPNLTVHADAANAATLREAAAAAASR